MSRRIITIDYLRGLAIVGIVVFHIIILTCELVTTASNDPMSLPPFYLIMTALVALLAHWRGLFLIISAIVNMYSMSTALKKGASRKSILKKQVFFGLILWLWGMFREVFLNEWSIPMDLFEDGVFALDKYWTWIYLSEALENIAWAIILTAIIFYFLTAKNGQEKMVRNCLVFGILAFIIIIGTEPLHELADAFWGVHFSGGGIEEGFKGWWDYILRLVVAQFFETESPLFPMLGYSFFGNVLGIMFAQEKPGKKILYINYIMSFALTGLGVFWLFVITGFPSNLGDLVDFHLHPAWFVFLSLGLQLLVLNLLMNFIEFNRNVNLKRAVRITRGLRRWGILALTIYSFLSLQYLIRVLLGPIFPNQELGVYRGLSFEWSLLLGLIMIVVWGIILRLWEKGMFKGSLEWLMLKIAKRGKKVNNEDPLNIKGVLYAVNPILWENPKKEQKIKYYVVGSSSE